MTLKANGKIERSNYKCLRPGGLVEAAAKHFAGFEGWQTAGLHALKLPRSILRV